MGVLGHQHYKWLGSKTDMLIHTLNPIDLSVIKGGRGYKAYKQSVLNFYVHIRDRALQQGAGVDGRADMVFSGTASSNHQKIHTRLPNLSQHGWLMTYRIHIL
jgi:hypothetical protein